MSANKILDSALSRFARQGYDGTSLAEIAADAGIRKASIYAHFSSKKELFLCLLAFAFRKEEEAIVQLGQKRNINDLEGYILGIGNRFGADDFMLFWLRAVYLPPQELAKEIEVYDEKYVRKMDATIEAVLKCYGEDHPETCQNLSTFVDAYCGIIRGVHGELLNHGVERARQKAHAMWTVYKLGLNNQAI